MMFPSESSTWMSDEIHSGTRNTVRCVQPRGLKADTAQKSKGSVFFSPVLLSSLFVLFSSLAYVLFSFLLFWSVLFCSVLCCCSVLFCSVLYFSSLFFFLCPLLFSSRSFLVLPIRGVESESCEVKFSSASKLRPLSLFCGEIRR